MKRDLQFADPVREAAARWSLMLRTEDPPPEQVSAWLEWVQADPAHLEAFDRAESLAGALDTLSAEKKSTLLRKYAPPGRRIFARRVVYALAASALVAAIGAGYWLVQQRLPFVATYVTAKAENRDLTLPDGTHVTLGAGTQLDVSYTAGERRVKLQDGEAYFAVEHNAARPFVVRVGDLHVTDIGTDFDIRKSGSHVTVTVAEGIVDVRRSEGAKPLVAIASASGVSANGVYRLKAGDQIRVTPAEDQPLLAHVDTARTAAWRDGRLDFQDETLAVVVADVNRYAAREIVIVDPAVARMRFTGTVFHDRIEDWLAGTSHLFELRTREAADGRILLYAGK